MDGVDTDLENYSIDDLFAILGVAHGSSTDQITDTANTTIARMTSEGKLELAIFLENAKNKLIEETAIRTASDEASDDEASDEASDDEASDDEASDEDKMAKKPSISKSSSQQQPKRMLNATQVIHFDTRYRENYYGTKSTSFTMNLPEVQSNVVSMRLSSIDVPYTHYSVSEALENNKMLVVGNPEGSYPNCYDAWLVRLPDGNYDGVWSVSSSFHVNRDFIKVMGSVNEALVTAKPGTLDDTTGIFTETDPTDPRKYLNKDIDYGKPTESEVFEEIKKKGDIFYSIDNTMNKSIFCYMKTNKVTSIRFNVDQKGCRDITTNIQCKLGWVLGFRRAEYRLVDPVPDSTDVQTTDVQTTDVQPGRVIVSEGIAFLSGAPYAFLSIDDYQTNAYPSYLVAHANSIKSDNTLTHVRLSTSSTYSRDEPFSKHVAKRKYFGPVDIQRLTIKICDSFGRIVDLNNMDWSFTLAFEKKIN